MKTYDLYGLRVTELEAARSLIEDALSLELVAHESGHHCGAYYRFRDVGQEHFIVQRNFDDFENEWTVPEHQDQAFLLYVNETERAQNIQKMLGGSANVKLLLHQEL